MDKCMRCREHIVNTYETSKLCHLCRLILCESPNIKCEQYFILYEKECLIEAYKKCLKYGTIPVLLKHSDKEYNINLSLRNTVYEAELIIQKELSLSYKPRLLYRNEKLWPDEMQPE